MRVAVIGRTAASRSLAGWPWPTGAGAGDRPRHREAAGASSSRSGSRGGPAPLWRAETGGWRPPAGKTMPARDSYPRWRTWPGPAVTAAAATSVHGCKRAAIVAAAHGDIVSSLATQAGVRRAVPVPPLHREQLRRAAATAGRSFPADMRVTGRRPRHRRRRCRWRAGQGCRGPALVVLGSACEAASCTSRRGTPRPCAAVMNACRIVWGVTVLAIPAWCPVGRTIRAALCRPGRRPHGGPAA